MKTKNEMFVTYLMKNGLIPSIELDANDLIIYNFEDNDELAEITELYYSFLSNEKKTVKDYFEKGFVVTAPNEARQLLQRGNKLIDIKPDREKKDKYNHSVFIFWNTKKIKKDLMSIRGEK